jgi:hypothetical protein
MSKHITTWEDMPDFGALWLRSCTRLGYQTFESWMRRNQPDIAVTGDMVDRAAQLHEVLLVKGMEAIEKEATA